MSHADDHEAVSRAVRDLVALPHEEKRRHGLFAARLAELSDVIRRVPSSWERLDRDVEMRDLRIDEVGEETAAAFVDAETRESYRHPLYGPWATTTSFTGPVCLVRVDGAWKIADFCLGGRMCLDSTILLDAAVTAREATVTVRALALDAYETTAFFECENAVAAPAPLELVAAAIARPSRLHARWDHRPIDGDRQILSGEKGFAKTVWPIVFPLETPKVRMLVRARDIPRHAPSAFRFALDLPSLEERRAAA